MKLLERITMIRIYCGENDRWQQQPLYEAIVNEAHRHDIAGATAFRGIEGYGASSRIHRRQLLGLSGDLPIMVTIIDEPDKIEAFMPTLEQMVSEGMIAISEVDVIRYSTAP